MNTLECITLLLIDASVKHNCLMLFETIIDEYAESDIEYLKEFLQQRIPESHSLFFDFYKSLLTVRIQPKEK